LRRSVAGAIVAACAFIGAESARSPVQSAPSVVRVAPEAASLPPFWSTSVYQDGDQFGSSVASGDVNGDGLADIIVGAPSYDLTPPDSGNANQGRVFVYLGSFIAPSVAPAYTLDDPSQGFTYFGTAVASGGDFDHSGTDDILVGVPSFFRSVFDPVPGTGRVYLYRGLSQTPVDWPGVGTTADRAYGSAVAFAGDVNHDGYDDIVVGDPDYSGNANQEGRVLFYFGGPSGPADDADEIIVGGSPGARFGAAIAAAGDVNHDGFADVVIGAPGGGVTGYPGSVMLFLGSPGGLSPVPSWSISQTGSFNFGRVLKSAGDVNGDGNEDLIAGGQWFGNPVVFLYEGTGFGFQSTPAWSAGEGIVDSGTPVGSGDFNHDGFSDVAVGNPLGGSAGEGSVSVYLGSPQGLNNVPGWVAYGGAQSLSLGRAVAVGDLDGDGLADVIAGGPGNPGADPGTGPAYGAAFAYPGVGTPPLRILDPMCSTATDCRGPYLIKTADGQAVINPDPAVLAGALVGRDSVVADGVTRLLLRQKNGTPVTFRLLDAQGVPLSSAYGLLHSLDESAIGTSITVQPQAVGTDQYVVAEYRPPQIFPGSGQEIMNGVAMMIEAGSAEGIVRTPLRLKPPPLVLVHGLWSDSGVWKKPNGGLLAALRQQGYVVCPDCLVDYSGSNSAASFDPWADSSQDQFAVRALIAATDAARDGMRASGTAATQVDVVAHSMGALMTRSRVAYRAWPYRRFMNYEAGDFHKLISIGSPHRGSEMATALLEDRCRPFVFPTLRGFFEFWGMPFGPGLFQLQPGSDALRHVGDPAIVQAPTYPIVGIEPLGSGVNGAGSFSEARYNVIFREVGDSRTVDDILGGEGAHDTIVNVISQRGGLPFQTTDVQNVVHADPTLDHTDPSELKSQEVWDSVVEFLQAPLTLFNSLPPYQEQATVLRDGEPCPTTSAARPGISSSATVTLTPVPGTVVQPGGTVNIHFEVTGGNAVDGAAFVIGDGLNIIEGPGPYGFTYTAPSDRVGDLPIFAGTFGPGPENYSASTLLSVSSSRPAISISASPSRLSFFRAGEIQGLVVTGHYADGSEVNLTSPSSGTTYSLASGAPTVVSVTPAGMVQAIAGGVDQIVVSSLGQVALVPVQVTLSNLAPIVAAPGLVSVEAEHTVQVSFSAADPEGGPVTLRVDGLPGFAAFTDLGGGSGRLTLQPRIADIGTRTTLISATDEGDPPFAGTSQMTITVTPCQQPLPGPIDLSFDDGFTISWTAADNATAYDMVGGFVDTLTGSGGDFSVSTVACLANDRAGTSLTFFGTPPPGRAIWLLVRGVSCAGNGSYDDPDSGSQVASRDPGIAASPSHCP
jgi:pimeloyl-ACP methyl ester carboxylesterase